MASEPGGASPLMHRPICPRAYATASNRQTPPGPAGVRYAGLLVHHHRPGRPIHHAQWR